MVGYEDLYDQLRRDEREAVRQALHDVRIHYLGMVLAIRKDLGPVDDESLVHHAVIDGLIARLRRQLKLPSPDLERRRALTRDRVRRFRERQQAAQQQP